MADLTLGPRLLALALVAALSACGGSGGEERQSILRTVGLRQPPPDEFLVVERKPLEQPGTYTELPAPQPGGVNRVDPQPQAEVLTLLTGTAGPQTVAAGESPGEAALLSQTGSADPSIREAVNAEDAERGDGSRLYGLRTLFGRQTADPYRADVLDAEAERKRLLATGVQTPAAPPPPPEDPEGGIKLF